MNRKLYLLLVATVIACQPKQSNQKDPLHAYLIEDGFALEIIASEPLLESPVAIDFDSQGRIWVAEMNSYMKNTQGTGMEDPTGHIVILEDQNKDGVADTSSVFLSGLVLPRALALVYGGLLYAEPPNLWFVEIENNQPGARVLVDSLYAATGNPEHQPNGLLLNIDNWIYNAKSQYRYRRKNGVWEKEATSFRGQWGITHDDFGRLYYNNNYTQLIGDYVLPNRLIRNRYFKPTIGVNEILTEDQRVYPLHAASVNRGYVPGVLTEDSLLVHVTAACGPQVYRGGNFPKGYDENVFVCIPEANLIKRNILTFSGDKVEAQQAWQGKEFLASLDEGFRPVNISNGPDGSLYIVDMHRGVIGHYAYLSPYLKEKIKLKQLDSMVNMGRILKISHSNIPSQETPDLTKLSGGELAELLKSKNGWLRDRAQHFIVYKNQIDATPKLEQLAADTTNAIAQIHALYALQGVDRLSIDLLKNVIQSSKSETIAHAIVLLEDFISKEHALSVRAIFQNLIHKNDKQIDLYLASSLGNWSALSSALFYPLLLELADKYQDNSLIQTAIISGFSDSEKFSGFLSTQKKSSFDSLKKILVSSIQNKKQGLLNPIFSNVVLAEDNRTKGWKLFQKTCSTCHGTEGLGIEGLAPPLMKSEYVAQSTKRLGLIILHGIKGPIHINGKLYKRGHAMPGFVNNETLTDDNIADIISYVTSAFSDTPKNISVQELRKLRNLKPQSGSEYTEQELLKIPVGEDIKLNIK